MKNIKHICSFLLIFVLAFVLIGCQDDTDKVNQELLEEKADKLYIGLAGEEINSDMDLPKLLLGEADFTITWVSNNTAVIEIKEYPSDNTKSDRYYLGSVELATEKTTVRLTATITYLTYTTTRTFDITVVADEYEEVATIALAKEKGEKVANTSKIKITGTIAHVTTSGYFVTDGTDTIYAYQADHGRSVGEEVVVRATWATYNNMPQLANTAVKVTGKNNSFSINDVAQEMTVSEIDNLTVSTLDSVNCTLVAKTIFQVESLPSGSYNTYKLVDVNGQFVEVSKYNDAATLTFIGTLDTVKFYEAVVITYCSRGSGIWDVIVLPSTAKEVSITLTDQQKVDKIKSNLESYFLSYNVKGNLVLPVNNDYEAAITWASNNPNVIGHDGTFNVPETDVKVKLTATIVLNDITETIEFEFTAKAETKHRNYIEEVRSSYAGSDIAGVTVEGVVTNVIGNTYYLQDGDIAIMIYNHSGHQFAAGDNVSVTGTLTVYNGLYEIKTITASSKIDKRYTATNLEITDFDKTALTGLDNCLFSVYNLIYKSGKMTPSTTLASGYAASNIIFTAADGTDITVRTDAYMLPAVAEAMAAVIDDLTVGDIVSLVNVNLGWYNGPQITPSAASQFQGENTIKTVRESHNGSDIEGVTVKGVVTNVIGNTYYVQDNDYAIMIYNQTGHTNVVGDYVTVTGKLTVYNGLFEITGATSSKIEDVYYAKAVIVSEYGTEQLLGLDSALITLYNLTYKSGKMEVSTDSKHTSGYKAATLIFTNADGVDITVRTDAYMSATEAETLALIINALVEGDLVDLVNVNLGWYNGPQVTPSLASQIQVNTIANVRNSYQGTNIENVTVEGVVTNIIGNTYYLQNGDYAIMIYNQANHGHVVGDNVSVTGTLTVYNGLYEITGATSTVISKTFRAYSYVIETYEKDALEGLDNALISLYGLTYKSGIMEESTDSRHTSGYKAATLIFTNAAGVDITVRTDAYMSATEAEALALIINALVEGDVVNLSCVNLGWYNGPQVTPSLASQITVLGQ